MYYFGFENGKHLGVLALVVLFSIFEIGQHVDVLVCVEFALGSKVVNMLIFYNFMS